MNLSKPFIQRPVFTTLTMITVVVFGILAYYRLPVSSIPQLEYPTIQVNTNYPGASAERVAKQVSGPLERQFMLMQGINFVSTSNTYGNSLIILQFHLDVDINIAAQETEQAIQKALAQLPPNLPQNPVYDKFNPSDSPILIAVVYSDTINPWTIYKYGYNFLGQQIGTVEGVAQIKTYGYPYAARVRVDPEKLAARNITLSEVATAIDQGNSQQPTGKFYGKDHSIATLTEGQLYTADDYRPLIIKYVDGMPVRLQDVATVEDGIQNDKQNFRWFDKEHKEGQAACILSIYRQLGYNTVKACDDIIQLLDGLRSQIPAGIKIAIPFLLSTWIKQSVEDVEFTLIVAFLLVVIVIFLYLGRLKNSIIPLITLPITIIGTFIFMLIFNYSLDIMSLSAITLSIGFLIDDAIVVLENIVRWSQEKGLSSYEASIEGSKQIILVVVSTSLCLCAVFIPMLFLGGAIGQMFHEFSAVIIIAVAISSFISLSLTPMLCSRFLANYDHNRKTKMEIASEWLNDLLVRFYAVFLRFSLKNKYIVVIGATASVVLSVFAFLSMPMEFLPENDLGIIQGFGQAPEGTSPEKMGTYMDQISAIAMQNPDVKTLISLQSTPADNQCLMFYQLTDEKKRPDIWKVMENLGQKNRDVVGINLFTKALPLINLQLGGVMAGKASYQYVLQSLDQDKLYQGTTALVNNMRKSAKLASVSSDFQPNSPALKVDLLRDQAMTYGNITANDIENAFKYAYGETYISKINTTENMYYVIMETEKQFLTDPSKLSMLYLSNKKSPLINTQVPIESVIDTKIVTKPETVNALNSLPSVTVAFDPAPGVPLSDAIDEMNILTKEALGSDVMTRIVGNTEAFQKASAQFISLIILSIFVIYIILGVLYENFLHPFTAISSVPVALLGGVVTLMIFGKSLSIYALVGLIMLMGIVMKNGILIIDFSLEIMEKEQKNEHEAVYKACLIRFRPIMMTTVSTIVGALPIALGIGGTVAKGRAPLGIAVVGGLIFAQIVSLFVCPITFIYVQKLSTFLTTRFAIFRPADKAE